MNHVFARLQLHVVGDVNGGHQEAELQGEVAPQGADALEQLAALRLIDERHQRVTHLQAQFVELEQLLDLLLGAGLLVRFRRRGVTRRLGFRFRSARGEIKRNRRKEKEREFRQTGNQPEQQHHSRRDTQRIFLGQELPAQLDAHGFDPWKCA